MKAFYIAGTHWDREWYRPFQEYRMWLVQTVDQAMDLLEKDPDYRVFHLDGQSVLLEDYFEIRPEQRERLAGHLRAGRMFAGPWYVLADEWLVSGEALVRNLQLGMRVVRELGAEPMPIGYVPDLFGHVASLPMIVAGFGLKGCVLWRGTTDDFGGAQFVWKGPDGSAVLTHKLPDRGGYGGFLPRVRGPWLRSGRTDEALREAAGEFLRTERRRANAPLMLLPDAMDHDRASPAAPEMLRRLRALFPEIEFRHASLVEYFEQLSEHAGALPERSGELRTTAREPDDDQWLIPDVLSSRYPLKQLNDRCQNLLCLWAEPTAAMAALCGRALHEGYLRTAWKWLIKNQPHDSICGCSIDAVHEDMMFRYHQCLRIADGVRRQAVAALADATAYVETAYENVTVWNPLPWERREVATLDLLFPPHFGPKAALGHSGPVRNQFVLTDADGGLIPYQILAVERGRQVRVAGPEGRHLRASCEDGERVDVYRVALPLDLPAGGFTTVRVRPLEHSVRRDFGTMRTGPLSAENPFLRFELLHDGTGVLENRDGGRRYAGLFCYEDAGDRGDGWTFIAPASNEVVVSPGHAVECGVAHDGRQMVTFRVNRVLDVPAGLEPTDPERRSSRRVGLKITDYVMLTRTSPCVLVRTVVENNACDHRLRVMFPSDVRADTYFADQAFAFVERPVARDPESVHYREADPEARPHHSIFGVSDERGGLAVLCPEGLHEHAVFDDERRTLALTLLRATGRTVQTDGEPGGQLIGLHEFVYALLPFAGQLDRAEALRQVAALRAGVYGHYSAANAGRRSMVEITGDPRVVATCLKPAWGSADLIVRLWNTGSKEARSTLRLDADIAGAWLCDLDERETRDLAVDGRGLSVDVPALGLATVRVRLA